MNLVQKSDYERDNIKYEIKVFAEKGKYYGYWFCTECIETNPGSASNPSSAECDSIEDAKRAAIQNTFLHHGNCHLI